MNSAEKVTPYYRALGAVDPAIRLQFQKSELENDPILPDWAKRMSLAVYGREAPWTADAIGDLHRQVAPRLTHRYGNRALLHVASTCAVHCRFCFRKSMLAAEEPKLYTGEWGEALIYLRMHAEIEELILTGGDPLSLTDSKLLQLFESLESIPSIRTVRIHTRSVVTLPSRVNEGLLDLLGRRWSFQIQVMNHFNHPRELSIEATQALKTLRRVGLPLMNQSVFLREINADFETLRALMQGLYRHGVIPVYLHFPDWTPQTFGFRHSLEYAIGTYTKLRRVVSGPALPHLVWDDPRALGKTHLSSNEEMRILETGVEPGVNGSSIGFERIELVRSGLEALNFYWKR